MNLNIENFNIRRSKPYLAGPNGLAPGEERYIAKAQGLVGFEIFAEDKISIKNIEGKQTCEIVVFDQTGKSSPNLITHQSTGLFSKSKFITNILINDKDKKFLLTKLKKRNIDFYNATSINFFDQETVSGETIDLTCQDNGFIIIASQGEAMEIDSHNAASDLEVKVQRKKINNNKLDYFLPDPLSNTKEEYLIKDSTALAYEVKEGDFNE